MNLTIQLTEEQANQLAKQIKAGVPTPAPAPALPEPPEGFHPAMMGPLKCLANDRQLRDVAMLLDDGWSVSLWAGINGGKFYALRIGSEIAMLNGLEVEALPDEPEPRKAREWEASVSRLGSIGHASDHLEKIRVREVLPGEPTQERVQALVDALESISRRGVIMGSVGDYREGQLHALSEVRTIALTAIATFREKK